MNFSQEVIDRYQVEPKGQLQFWTDNDLLLVNTPYQETDDPDFDKKTVVHWWMNIYKPGTGFPEERTEYPIYSTWSNAIYKYFKYVYTGCGYRPETNQQCVSIKLIKKEPLEPQKDELMMWLPHIKADKDGNKTIEIFDQSCSANGCYSLVVKENGKCDIGLMRYHSPSVVKGDLSLDEALEYIQKNLYYRKKPSEY